MQESKISMLTFDRVENLDGIQVTKVCSKSVMFYIPSIDKHAYATKRVANEILMSNPQYVFIEKDSNGLYWLLTPSRF
jgi:hypothetical protein